MRADRAVWGFAALWAAMLLVAAPAAADLGTRVYHERCSACHGDDGAGDGPAAGAIDPKPRNFRDPAFWRGRTRDQIRVVVQHGRPGTMMAAFGEVLTPEEIEAVVSHVMGFGPGTEGDGDASPGDGEAPPARPGEDASGRDAGT